MLHFNRDLCRIYHQAGSPGKAWTIDFGEGTQQYHVDDVALADVSAGTCNNLAVLQPAGRGVIGVHVHERRRPLSVIRMRVLK